MLLIAAGLGMFLGVAHSYLGERYLLTRLFRRDDLPKLGGSAEFTKQVLRFAWHLTSVAWLGFAALLVALSRHDIPSRAALGQIVASTFGISGLVALLGSRARHPSWVVFLAIALLAWLGTR
jgi:hypothetical protein